MNKEQIQAARERAADVVNGFKRVTDQIARDVVKLAETCEAKDKQIEAMKKRMLADALLNAAKTGRPRHPLDDFFKGLGL